MSTKYSANCDSFHRQNARGANYLPYYLCNVIFWYEKLTFKPWDFFNKVFAYFKTVLIEITLELGQL